MSLQKGDFIKVNYTGKFKDGNIFDTTIESISKENNIYNENGVYGGDIVIIGAKNTIDGLDEDFIGKDVGYETEIELTPEKAFGLPDPKLITSISISKIKSGNIKVGSIVEQNGKQGIITRIIGRRVTIDFNNPLTGKNVIYTYKIEEKIDDLKNKINGLFKLYTGIKDTKIEINENTAIIYIPKILTYNQKWLFIKNKFLKDIFDYTNINNIKFIEDHKKDDKNQL